MKFRWTGPFHWLFPAQANAGGDFAAWGAGLDACWGGGREACVFLNDTVRGPFLPRYVDEPRGWPALFCARLSGSVKLVGASVNSMVRWAPRFRRPHVQSMAFACDAPAVALLRAARIFKPEPDGARLVASCGALRDGLVVPGDQREKTAYVFMHEIRMSEVIADAGFEFYGFQVAETTGAFPMDDVQLDYDGDRLNPVETMFVKSSHGGFDVEGGLLRKYTAWLDGAAPPRPRRSKIAVRRA